MTDSGPSGLRPPQHCWRREFPLCPLTRIGEAFRYFWPNCGTRGKASLDVEFRPRDSLGRQFRFPPFGCLRDGFLETFDGRIPLGLALDRIERAA